ncbi:MAG: hypothetical protein IKS04_03970, partial [Clostridia bacterium]|nr:hypothetical protein [Clostridia bacterium]
MLKNKKIMLLTALTLAVCFALASCAMPGSGGETTFVSGEDYSEDVIPAGEGGVFIEAGVQIVQVIIDERFQGVVRVQRTAAGERLVIA